MRLFSWLFKGERDISRDMRFADLQAGQTIVANGYPAGPNACAGCWTDGDEFVVGDYLGEPTFECRQKIGWTLHFLKRHKDENGLVPFRLKEPSPVPITVAAAS